MFGVVPYTDSKLANALFAVELAERLKGTQVTVNFVHPGVVSTGLARDMNAFFRSAASRTWAEGFASLQSSKYFPVTPSSAGEAAT